MPRKHSHYFKDVSKLTEVDVYRVCDIFKVEDPSGATQHAIKKLLLPGKRGAGKSRSTDLKEAVDTLLRRIEMYEEDDGLVANFHFSAPEKPQIPVRYMGLELREWVDIISFSRSQYEELGLSNHANLLALYRQWVTHGGDNKKLLHKCRAVDWAEFFKVAIENMKFNQNQQFAGNNEKDYERRFREESTRIFNQLED